MSDIWDKILESDKLTRAIFDLRFSEAIERIIQERLAIKDDEPVGPLSSGEEEKIAREIWADLTGPPKMTEYEEVIRSQELYRKLEER